MALIVQKYGGSSLATPDHIRRVARHVVERKDQNCDLVVVVSAMKMESEYKVKKDRVIKEVKVKAGDTIDGNQPLVIVE